MPVALRRNLKTARAIRKLLKEKRVSSRDVRKLKRQLASISVRTTKPMKEKKLMFMQVASMNVAAKKKLVSPGPITFRELHDAPSGKLDASKIASTLGLSVTSFAKALGHPVATIHRSPASKGIQKDLGPIASVITTLNTLLTKPEYVRMWLNSPNPELGYETAMSFILAGKADRVRDLLNSARSGQIT
jgi:antitoxin Xre/MbcA/ParS-like protein